MFGNFSEPRRNQTHQKAKNLHSTRPITTQHNTWVDLNHVQHCLYPPGALDSAASPLTKKSGSATDPAQLFEFKTAGAP